MGEVQEAYSACRRRISDLARGLDDEQAAVRVVTCPQWSVHDLVAHVSGVVDDALNGRLDGVATDSWTAAQVDARRDWTIADMLRQWDEQGPSFEALLDDIGDPGRQAVADIVTHEHDLRYAIQQPGARDSDAVAIGFGFTGQWFATTAAEQDVNVRIAATDGMRFGDDNAALGFKGTSFDLLRTLTGRRSLDQIRQLDWDGDCEQALPLFTWGPFRPADSPIAE